jgi:hypothetical protein
LVSSKVGTTNRRGEQAVSVTKLRKFHALFSDAWTSKSTNGIGIVLFSSVHVAVRVCPTADSGGNAALAEELRFLTKGDKDNQDDEGETFTLEDMYFFCKYVRGYDEHWARDVSRLCVLLCVCTARRNLKVFEPIRFIHTYLRHNLLTASYWVDLRNKWMDELDVMIAASGNKRTRPQPVGGGAFASRSIDVALPACFVDVVGREKAAKTAPGILVHANQRSRVAMVRPAGIETGLSVRFGETKLCLYDAEEEPNTPTKLSSLSSPPPTASIVRTLGRPGAPMAVLTSPVSTASTTLLGNASPLIGGSPGSTRKVSDVMLEPGPPGTFEIAASPRASSPSGARYYSKRSHPTPRSKLSAV